MKKLVPIAMFLVLGCLFSNVFCLASELQMKDEQLLLKDRLLSLDRQNNFSSYFSIDQAEEKISELGNKTANEFSAYSGSTWFSEDPNDLAPLKGTKWEFTFTIVSTFTDTITFGTDIIRESSTNVVALPCRNEYGSQGFVFYTSFPWGGRGFSVVINGPLLTEFYSFTISGNTATGKYSFQNNSTGWDSDFYYMTGVKISGPSVPVCDANHPDLCTTETECTGAGLNWCNGHCQAEKCANQLPLIDSFAANSTSGESPLYVTFTCQAHDPDGSIASYRLDYGDGTSDSSATGTFTHSYNNSGVYQATCTAVDDNGASTTSGMVTITVTVPACDADHLNLCTIQAECTGAGGYWCNGQCQAKACAIISKVSPTLDPQYNNGIGTWDPTANQITVPIAQKSSITIAPALNVPVADQGKKVSLYAAIVAGDTLYMAKGVSWVPYAGFIPSFGTATLGTTQTFNLGSLPRSNPFIDLLGGSPSPNTYDIYYGYATQPDFSDFVGTSYELIFK